MFYFLRDKYLSQLQLMYTEKLAKKGCVTAGGVVQKTSDGYFEEENTKELEELEKRSGNILLSRRKDDERYGPSFRRITVLDSERFNMGEDVDFLEGCYKKIDTRMDEENVTMQETKIIRKVDGELMESATDAKSFVNQGYLDADTMLDFLTVTDQERANDNAAEERQLPFIYRDTTLSRAAADVKTRVKNAGKQLLPQKPSMQEMNFNYRGKRLEDIGRFERAYVRCSMYKNAALPDFDVGYDTV